MEHTFVDLDRLTERQRYKLLSGAIIPRPIALVTTVSEAGTPNAAPFSFFNVLSSDPGVVALGLELNPDGTLKDTTVNIQNTEEFTVNIVSVQMAEQMNICAISFDRGVSELTDAGLTAVPGKCVRSPYIKESPASFECRRVISVAISKSREIILGRIVGAHFRPDVVDLENCYIDASALDPIARIEGSNYATVRDRFRMPMLSLEEGRLRKLATKIVPE
ncbi:MAG: flavin reductase family protein [Pseudolabrys sp.]